MNSYFMDVNVMAEQRRDRLHAAEEKLLLQRSGHLGRGWFARSACTLLCGAGRLLMSVGQELMWYAAASVDAAPLPPRLTGAATGR